MKCPYTPEKPYYRNREGFLDDPSEDDPFRVLCLDFDVYCNVCKEAEMEAMRDYAEGLIGTPPWSQWHLALLSSSVSGIIIN